MPFLAPLPPSEKNQKKALQRNSFCPVLSISPPGCHSLTIMWSMKFTDGLKRQQNPPLCYIYLCFLGRARLRNWQKNKWHFSWVDNKRVHCISGIYWLYMRADLEAAPGGEQALWLSPRHPACQSSTLPFSLRFSSAMDLWNLTGINESHGV